MSMITILDKIAEKNQGTNPVYRTPTVTVARILACATEVDAASVIITQYKGDLARLMTNLATRLGTDNMMMSSTVNQANIAIGTRQNIQTNLATQEYVNKAIEIYGREAANVQGQPNGAQMENTGPNFKHFLHAIHQVESTKQDQPFMAILQQANFDWKEFLAVANPQSEKDVLAELCINLNELAKEGKIDPVIYRDEEINKVLESLFKRRSNNCVLLGNAGVGKTAIAEGLAYKIVNGQVPEAAKDAIVYSLNIADMMAGTSFRGQLEEKVQKLMKYLEKQNQEGKIVILFIDEIHTIMGQGANGADINNMIKPYLSRGVVRCIGATTGAEWNTFIRQDKAFSRRFEQIDILEFSVEKTIEVLKLAKDHYEAFHQVTYTDASIEAAVRLSVAYINKSALPDKAFQIFDLAGSFCRINGKMTVEAADLETILSKHRGINIEVITKDKEKKKRTVRLGVELKNTVFHQDQAVDLVAKAVERHQAGFIKANRPIGSFLFVGPTGVGKTELANALGTALNCKVLRFDMSEYQQEFAVTKLIGAPAGYVGYESNGSLCDAIEKNPYAVLLIDEIEKAHPKITEIFLQIMDNAKLKNNKGDDIDCKNVVLIFTTNAGAADRQKSAMGLGLDNSAQDSKANSQVANFFSPEFRNRLNAVVPFNALTQAQMLPIVDKFVKRLHTTEGIASRGIVVTLDEAAQMWIVNKDFDPKMGARPIDRKIATYIEDRIVEEAIEGRLENVNRIEVTVENDELKFTFKQREVISA